MTIKKEVVASWSGGIDSTAVIANLLASGYSVHAVSLSFYKPEFTERELKARTELFPILSKIKKGDAYFKTTDINADWIWNFSSDGIEIPRRNKHIIDYIIMQFMVPNEIYNIGMGEYVGADTWVVQDHVGASDADHRAIETYLYIEYGIKYRLFSLRDFGESRYKVDRVRIGKNIIGDNMTVTSNCLLPVKEHCGTCYKCIERAAAFDLNNIIDTTIYTENPRKQKYYNKYKKQMTGIEVRGSFSDFK